MYYPDEVIEEVRSRNDIVDVISGYIDVYKRQAYPFVRLLLLVGFTETPHSFGDTRFWMHFRIWQTMLPLSLIHI